MPLTTRLFKLLLTGVCFLAAAENSAVRASSPVNVTIHVCDQADSTSMPYALVNLVGADGRARQGVTGQDGDCLLSLPSAGACKVQVTYVGYYPYEASVQIVGEGRFVVRMRQSTTDMQAVVVTATEAGGMTSASVIKRDAMEHLQPSSFSDIMELLPGGMAESPSLGTPNQIHLREARAFSTNSSDGTPSYFGGTSGDYSTSALGTSFMVDGAPISTNAGLGYLEGASQSDAADNRNFMNRGVDMRTISTDDIESIEIIRGIASVEYGELTSGLVRIERKRGGRNFDARFKADMSSKLYYIGKGFESRDGSFTLNASLEFLDSKSDPRNNQLSYNRLSGSLRMSKRWDRGAYRITYRAELDYTGSFDRVKVDPDLNAGKLDRYTSDHNSVRLGNSLTISSLDKERFLQKLSLSGSVSALFDKAVREKYVYSNNLTYVYDHTEPGVYYIDVLPIDYVGKQEVDDKPFGASFKAVADMRMRTGAVKHALKAGAEWGMDKNYGEGQIFDIRKPVYPMSGRLVHRSYSDIPASHRLSFFAEDLATLDAGGYRISVMAGLRAASMLNIADSYRMHGRFYLDPRANAKVQFPGLRIGGRVLKAALSGGFGWHTKFPTMDQMYPNRDYIDFTQKIFADRINVRTYVLDATNYRLGPARNFKWEVGGDLSIDGHRLSVTYFREDMRSGFRNSYSVNAYDYRKYGTMKDALGNDVDPQPTIIDDLPYEEMSALVMSRMYTNGSRTKKEGVEFTFSSKRIESIRTRLTVNGAWMKTSFMNDEPQYYRPSIVLNNEAYKYVGIYETGDGYMNEMFNTNFGFDTDIPRLGMRFSVSFQCLWFTRYQKTSVLRGMPTEYMDNFGGRHAYTPYMAADPYLQHLDINVNSSWNDVWRVPFGMDVNIKATKSLYRDRLTVALFVNRLFDYHPDFKRNGMVIRRKVTPYFGMELNLKI